MRFHLINVIVIIICKACKTQDIIPELLSSEVLIDREPTTTRTLETIPTTECTKHRSSTETSSSAMSIENESPSIEAITTESSTQITSGEFERTNQELSNQTTDNKSSLIQLEKISTETKEQSSLLQLTSAETTTSTASSESESSILETITTENTTQTMLEEFPSTNEELSKQMNDTESASIQLTASIQRSISSTMISAETSTSTVSSDNELSTWEINTTEGTIQTSSEKLLSTKTPYTVTNDWDKNFSTTTSTLTEMPIEPFETTLSESSSVHCANSEKHASVAAQEALSLTTVISKLDYLTDEIQVISKKMEDFQIRLRYQENISGHLENHQLKSIIELKNLLQEQNLRNEHLLREIEENCSKRFQTQESITEMLYRNKINFKQELNYVVEAQNLKNEKLFQDMEEYLRKRFEKLLKHGQKTAPNQNQGVVQNSPIQPVKQNYNWLVLLRRQDGSEDFYRNWLEYKQGFGSSNGEFFIGLEKLHAITTYGGTHELLIVLEDFENSTRYAYYDEFLVGNEDERYGLKKLGKYSGNAGDALRLHVNAMFSTQDRDNDVWHQNCAELFKGAWWFVRCFNSHLTGPYIRASSPVGYNERGIIWKSFHGPKYSMKFVEMMIRPRH